jgi:hypothetical protein
MSTASTKPRPPEAKPEALTVEEHAACTDPHDTAQDAQEHVMSHMKIHPAAEAYRLMTDEELAGLTANIAEHGQRDAIVLGRVNGAETEAVVDGRNRLRACEIIGVEPRFETKEFKDDDEVRAFVRSRNERRDLSKGERAMAVAMLYPEPERGRGKKDAARKDAETSSFTYRRVQQARQVLHHSSELALAVRDGSLKLDQALARKSHTIFA